MPDKSQNSKCHRFNIPGHAHDLTFSCFQRKTFLKSGYAKQFLVEAINASRVKYQYDIWAWVFMPEHVHLLIFPRPETYSISDILRSIKQPVAQRMVRFLKKRSPKALVHLETGLRRPQYRFWQDGGGYDRNYWSTKEIHEQTKYIHNNPVKRGLVDTAVEWEWSSAREWILGEEGVIPIDRESFPST